MGRAIDTLEARMEELADNPTKTANETFIMGISDEYVEELLPLKKYLKIMFESKSG